MRDRGKGHDAACFNGAGLIQPGGPAMPMHVSGQSEDASMGPGLFSPEDPLRRCTFADIPPVCFNGAGLIQPGGPMVIVDCLGNLVASMGPGLFSPEDRAGRYSGSVAFRRFNGAGLIQPGGPWRLRPA